MTPKHVDGPRQSDDAEIREARALRERAEALTTQLVTTIEADAKPRWLRMLGRTMQNSFGAEYHMSLEPQLPRRFTVPDERSP